jgi:hypothetical protein
MRTSIWTSGFLLLLGSMAMAQNGSNILPQTHKCDDPTGILCTEIYDSIYYEYIGHDEPSLLFYSNEPGSGYTGIYKLRLPKDPPTVPKQGGSGGTWNFQLHPAFWFGMAMCDDQSAPNPGGSSVSPNILCKPDSDSNIFDNSDPAKPGYIGKHPGSAFMEMQFYPPGWFVGNSLTQWTAALNIDSLSQNLNTGQGNNSACGGAIEYVNFAFIQTDGVPFPPGSPSPLGPLVATNFKTLFMDPGDELVVTLKDTEHGLKITVDDLTSGQSGFMVASAANGFAEILFDPSGNNCDFATHNLPYDFHPMYATSSTHTRVPWAAHSYGIAFSDEIGHFEYCRAVAKEGGACISSGIKDPPGLDETFCFDAAFAASFGFVPIGGCLDADIEFDGVPYQKNWPGTFKDVTRDQKLHAQPIQFTSPLFINQSGSKQNYSRVAFETDLPRVETNTNPPCQRHISNPADPNPGQGCVNPPVGATFYPIYSTAQGKHGCIWQVGGALIPGTQNSFGGNSTAEYGQLLRLAYPAPNGQPSFRYNDFRRVLPTNPCPQ